MTSYEGSVIVLEAFEGLRILGEPGLFSPGLSQEVGLCSDGLRGL